MSDTKFCFKKFNIHQDLCAMKVGTDSVLLGAWATLPQEGRILDIGAGTGILSLMAAQRTAAFITAIEIEPNAARQARYNIQESVWNERISVVEGNFTQWVTATSDTFDCIISNPPFFEQSLLSPDDRRTRARHTTMLTYKDIFELSRNIISTTGHLAMIIPYDLYNSINKTAMLYGWGATRMTKVCTTPRKTAKRALCQWQRNYYGNCHETTLYLRSADGEYSEEYKHLTADFYLNF